MAELLGVTIPMVRVLEKQGRISAKRVDGNVSYDAIEIHAFAKTYTPGPKAIRHRVAHKGSKVPKGKTGAGMAMKVFAVFKLGFQNVADVVAKTGCHPDRVEELWIRYRKPLGVRTQEKEQKRAAEKEQRRLDRDAYIARRERLALIQSGKLDENTIRRLAREHG